MNIKSEIEVRGKIWFHSMNCLFSEFKKQGIAYALLKGESLSFYAYGEFGRRVSNDVDLLVNKVDLSKIDGIMAKCGFSQQFDGFEKVTRADVIATVMNSHQTVTYKKRIMPYNMLLEIDINFSLMWGEIELNILDVTEFLSNTVSMEIYGENVAVLSARYAFIQVLLHHYKDCNSIFVLYTREPFILSRLEEVYLFWKRNYEYISDDWLYEFSARNHILGYVFYMLYYTNEVYPDSDLKRYVNRLRTDEGDYLLNCFGLNAKERRQWNCTFQERLHSDDISRLLEPQLTDEDRKKINFNLKLF